MIDKPLCGGCQAWGHAPAMCDGKCKACQRTEAEITGAHGSAGFSPQIHLGAMLSEVAERIATGRMGDVAECVLFVRGKASAAIITLPQETNEETAKRLEVALHWIRTEELLP